MPVLPAAELERLVDRLEGLIGQAVAIEESISRDRERGHDRHCSTHSRLEFVVRHVGVTMSGAQIILEGDATWYGMSADAVAAVSYEPDLVIVERFEQRTERRTTIRVTAPT